MRAKVLWELNISLKFHVNCLLSYEVVGPSLRSYVSRPICLSVLSVTKVLIFPVYFFLIFCNKLAYSECKKVIKPDFRQKILNFLDCVSAAHTSPLKMDEYFHSRQSVELYVGKVSSQLQLSSSVCKVSSQHKLSYVLKKLVQRQLSSSVGKVSSQR